MNRATRIGIYFAMFVISIGILLLIGAIWLAASYSAPLSGYLVPGASLAVLVAGLTRLIIELRRGHKSP